MKAFYFSTLGICFLLSCFFVISLADASPEIWFGPNVQSDVLELFLHEDQWINARNKVDVFQLYHGQVNHKPFADIPVSVDRLVEVGAFQKLRAWNMSFSIEAGAVKPNALGCDPTHMSDNIIQTIRNIEQRGGFVTYIAMDEPLISGTNPEGDDGCGFTLEETARRTAIFVKIVKAAFPHVLIGDIEVVYPFFTVGEIQRWILALEKNGVVPAFFHFDTDPAGAIVASDLQVLSDFFKKKNIPFGVIYHGGVADYIDTSEAFFLNNTLWIMKVKEAIPLAEHHIFQSWARTSNKEKDETTLPINLPEDDLSIYSHTRMINEGWAILIDNDAQFIASSVPSTMEAGKKYPVILTFKNNSSIAWHGHEGYVVGAQMPEDGLWGVDRVPFDRNEVILPGAQKRFTFMVTAPMKPDTYPFQWQLLQEGVEWFGDVSPSTTITVAPASPRTLTEEPPVSRKNILSNPFFLLFIGLLFLLLLAFLLLHRRRRR